MNAEKLGEGLLDNLESCINKPVLGVREKLDHLVSGKNDMTSAADGDIFAKETLWDLVHCKFKVKGCRILRMMTLSRAVCSFG